MEIETERARTRTVLFRVVNEKNLTLKRRSTLQLDLVRSRTRVVWVRAEPSGIVWDSSKQEITGGFTRKIQLDVSEDVSIDGSGDETNGQSNGKPKSQPIRIRVDYVGAAPVVGGIRTNGQAIAEGEIERPETRITRRMQQLSRLPKKLQTYYRWFTMLDVSSDEAVIAAKTEPASAKARGVAPPKPDGKPPISPAITSLRTDLRTNLYARAMGARRGDDSLVCSPEFTADVAVNVLQIHERIFKDGAASMKALAGGDLRKPKALRRVTDAFLAFCQGDLRVVADRVSDLNVEPDSAMVFLFAEYALTLLQVVDHFGAPGGEDLENPEMQRAAQRLFADQGAIAAWKKAAAAFVLGQRAYMRAYSPRRLRGPARFEDYVRTNFDPAEKLDRDESTQLRKSYDSLAFTANGRPLEDTTLRFVFWRHAMNAVEAFPGDLEEDRSGHLGDLTLPAAGAVDQTATVPLRAPRGADATIRRHVRHVIASLSAPAHGISAKDTLSELGIDSARRACLAKMLAAYASASGGEIEPDELKLRPGSNVDSITLTLGGLISDEEIAKAATPKA